MMTGLVISGITAISLPSQVSLPTQVSLVNQCGNCLYWNVLSFRKEDAAKLGDGAGAPLSQYNFVGVGQCRKDVPEYASNIVNQWPMTTSSAWCGLWAST